MRKNFSLIATLILLAGCAATQQTCSHMKSGVIGLNRHIVLYANDGTVLREWDTRGTVEDQGGSFRFLVDNKAITVSGTIVIEER